MKYASRKPAISGINDKLRGKQIGIQNVNLLLPSRQPS
jgi:hypothetical protein